MSDAIRSKTIGGDSGALGSVCWCSEQSAELCFRTSRFGLLRCRRCGCYRTDPPPLESADDACRFYTEYYGESRAVPAIAAPRSRFWEVVARVPELGAPGELAVDVGCGDGHLCAQLRTAGWRSVIGLDVAAGRIAAARNRYPDITFSHGSIDALGLSVGSVDLMVMDNVVEHLTDPLGMVRQLASWLRLDAGRMVLITPNMESGHFRLLGRRWTPELAPHAHVYLFTPAALAQLASAAGLEVEKSGTFHLPLVPWPMWRETITGGAVKEMVWRLGQEAGAVYGRLLGAGPMQFVVGRRGSSPGCN